MGARGHSARKRRGRTVAVPPPVRVGVNQALFDLDLITRQPELGKDGVP